MCIFKCEIRNAEFGIIFPCHNVFACELRIVNLQIITRYCSAENLIVTTIIQHSEFRIPN